MITFLGYRFTVTRTADKTTYEAVDPDTPDDVIEALLKTVALNELCYLRRFGPSCVPAPVPPSA